MAAVHHFSRLRPRHNDVMANNDNEQQSSMAGKGKLGRIAK
jgi:hypothetical protein